MEWFEIIGLIADIIIIIITMFAIYFIRKYFIALKEAKKQFNEFKDKINEVINKFKNNPISRLLGGD